MNTINTENKLNDVWAIIPARSGSKGFPGKNIYPLDGVPLLAHSIKFAKTLPFVTKIFLSTDSKEYSEIGKKYGAEVPFLRSADASKDNSMEEDVLWDILQQCNNTGIQPPKHVVWLRPTHPIRDYNTYIDAYKKYSEEKYDSVCVVFREDPRIFKIKDEMLCPVINDFDTKSMVRRQDCEEHFRIFSGELFKFPTDYNKKFLGDKIGYVVAPNSCKVDIDYKEDIEYVNYLLSTEVGKQKYHKYLNY